MSIHVAIRHLTRYAYDRPVTLTPHLIRLRPAAHCRTPIRAYTLKIQPADHFINWQQDPFGNHVARVVFPEKVTHFEVDVEVIADMTVINPFDFFIEEQAEEFPFAYGPQLLKELHPYLETVKQSPLLDAWMKDIDRSPTRTVEFLVALNQRLQQHISYNIRLEPGVQTCEQTLEKRSGSCRDSAWLLVQILRQLGLGARFVSGYLVQLTADEKSLDGPSGTDHDFTDLHAWAEVYVPGGGWLGLDPTSGLFAGEGHIPLSCTPDPVSAAAITGNAGPAEVDFHYRNEVHRIHEDPRVTKPYTDAQWAAIDALGHQVDRDLVRQDVRLTMGGEPTFVSIDDMDGAAWSTTADSPEKRTLANTLLGRLKNRFAPGGMLHYGEGKWYPGEALPRWAYTCFWRKDGVPVWKDPRWIADIEEEGTAGHEDAERFMHAVSKRLGTPEQHILSAHEDVFYYAWKEGTLPANVDPLERNLKDSAERQFLTNLLNHDMGAPAGYVLPLRWDADRKTWVSAHWKFRHGTLFLVPGDSALGLRLPLDSVPKLEAGERPVDEDGCPFEEKEPIAEPDPSKPAAEGPCLTALCVEARKGRLHVFMPPVSELDAWLGLLAQVEACAAERKQAIVLEGYEPPHDRRLERLKVTPDPGVIEVNIHPAPDWPTLVEHTTALYDEARASRLASEKFMLDGRHTGTGGGNHVVLGAATPKDSPFLRRPSLLRSLITYWQHHPGLSYLFSGLFIGPTSQSPRVDEGRDDRLYELEIAFQQIPDGDVDTPWLADRLLRNLLTDLTGNTHRAEFCIDKLFSPDSNTGRLGLLELRAFEMPPHARMSLVQGLLLRCLVARFWDKPYKHDLVHWGTELHDRFMLPHFVRSDLKDVVDELQEAGYPFQLEWLEPFFEFRFPHCGSLQLGDIELDLRVAIEPWHVLGEESTSQGTARYVDSSVERLQVKVRGMTEERHAVACNGRRLTLHPTAVRNEYVVGLRYQAWAPYSALHPTIPPQTPLTFDLIDTWNGKTIGGCVYHVAHPAGRNYETLPVNAYEAESRRVSRFWNHGHSPGTIEVPVEAGATRRSFEPAPARGPMQAPPEEFNEDYPYTMDLRRKP